MIWKSVYSSNLSNKNRPMVLSNCAEGTLAPYIPSTDQPWDRRKVAHLYRRIGFSSNFEQRTNALEQSVADVVDNLIDAAIATPLISAPIWENWTFGDYDNFDEQSEEQISEWLVKWVNDFFDNPLRGKMTLFWSNHFVTELFAYNCPSYLYQYHTILQQYALGNFKEFVRAIGITPAMLVYLNGADNGKSEPNENYARELYELFTLGADNNYTQQDIEETARALTGYTNVVDECGAILFDANNHDTESKTIFGQTGDWGYDDVIDVLFENRASEIANFICEKLYKFFVHPEPIQGIVSSMASTLILNDWEIASVLRQLFKSQHFFDPEIPNTIIRSPYDLMLGLFNELDFVFPAESRSEIVNYGAYLGQFLSSPISVAGWQGNRAWISTSYLTARWDAGDFIVYYTYDNDPSNLQNLAHLIVGNPLESDPSIVTAKIIDYMIPGGLSDPTQYERATLVFKGFVPDNYFETGQWNLSWEAEIVGSQVALLLAYISKMPEMQLM